jgi:hypothetical protein
MAEKIGAETFRFTLVLSGALFCDFKNKQVNFSQRLAAQLNILRTSPVHEMASAVFHFVQLFKLSIYHLL